MLNDILTAALHLAAEGIPVFPCLNKRPVVANGFHSASADPEQIRAWFNNENDYQLAFRPADAGLIVIDVDLGANENDYRDLPPTFTVHTPSGGKHLYFWSEMAYSNRKWANRIDVRSGNGYVLAPPTRGYVIENPSQEVADLPAWAAERLRQVEEREPREPTDPDKLDLPQNVERARAYLEAVKPAVEGEGGDGHTFAVACTLRDLGVSQDKAAEIMGPWNERCQPPWAEDELAVKVANAYRYAENAEGCRALAKPAEALYSPAMLAAAKAEREERSRFHSRLPSEDENLPPLTYYDTEQTMPCLPDGGVLIVAGKTQSHKTGLVIKKCLDAIERTGANVLYVAAEGAHGIRTIRLPAYRRQRSMASETLDAHWRTLSESFDLFSASDRAELIGAYREFKPDIVVIDTLTRVTAGQDINAPATGAGINVHAEELARAFGGLVILIHHPGKDDSRGSLGSALIESLAYAVWRVSKNGDTVQCWVEKMKDGPAEFAVFYSIAWTAPGNIPCVRDQTAPERVGAMRRNEANQYVADVLAVLYEGHQLGAKTLNVRNVAEKLVRETENDRERHVKNEVRRLQRHIRGKPGKPSILSNLVKRDRRGEPLEPYEFIIPEPGNDFLAAA